MPSCRDSTVHLPVPVGVLGHPEHLGEIRLLQLSAPPTLPELIPEGSDEDFHPFVPAQGRARG
jgi:hypothetical protein